MSKLCSGIIFGPLSFGLPNPSNILPIISSETPNDKGFPKNLTFEFFKFIPAELSNS